MARCLSSSPDGWMDATHGHLVSVHIGIAAAHRVGAVQAVLRIPPSGPRWRCPGTDTEPRQRR